jgi:hypothetical protein
VISGPPGRWHRHGGKHGECRVGGEDLLVQLPQWRAGVGTEFASEPPSDLLVMSQGGGLPAAAVQGEDELACQPFIERVLFGNVGKLGDQAGVLAVAEPDVGQVELRGVALAGQHGANRVEPWGIQASKRLSPPQRQRFGEQSGPVVIAGRTCLDEQGLEPVQIDGGLVHR